MKRASITSALALSAVASVAGKQGSFSTESTGEAGTLDYRVLTLDSSGDPISVWHDVPMYAADGDLNFMCEVPFNTTAKFELQTEEPGNPVAQDVKDGKTRNYAVPIFWNYGMVPQTWEDPEDINKDLDGAGGDNDPLDVVEIAALPCTTGQVYHVKPICAFGMLDAGQVDWKLVVIPADHPEAANISDAKDAEREFPGELEAIREWFRDYKTLKNVNGTLEPSGDPPSEFGFDEACVDGDQLASVLNDNSESYQALISGERENTEGKALPEVRKTPSESSAAAKHLLLAAVPALLALVAQS